MARAAEVIRRHFVSNFARKIKPRLQQFGAKRAMDKKTGKKAGPSNTHWLIKEIVSRKRGKANEAYLGLFILALAAAEM